MRVFSRIFAPRIKTTMITLSDQAIYSGTIFLTGILVGRLLSVGDFGEFSLGLTLMVLSLVLQDGLLATPYSYSFHNSRTVNERAMRASALIQSQIFAGLCAAFLVPFALVIPLGDGKLDAILVALGLSLPFLFLRETLRRILFTEFEILSVLRMDTVVSVLQLGLIFALWRVGDLTTTIIFPLIAVASFVPALVYLIMQRSRYDFFRAAVRKDLRSGLLYGRWLLLGSAFHLGSLYLFPWLVYALGGKKEAGAFAACYTLINLLNPVILGFNNYFRPKIMEIYALEGVEAMHALITKMLLLFLPLALGGVCFLFFAGEFFVALIYGPDFAGLGFVISVMGVSIIAVLLNAPLQLGVLAMNRPEFNPRFHSVAFAVALIVGAPLVYFYGKEGAAVGYTLSVSSGFVVLCWLYYHEVRRVKVRTFRA